MATWLGKQDRTEAYPDSNVTVTEADVASAAAQLHTAQSLLEQGQTQSALKAAESAVGLNPRNAQAHRLVARAASLLRDSGKAKHAWRVVLHLVPGDVEALAGIKRFE